VKGINVKRGVESTLERVFNNTGRKFDTLRFSWSGTTAGVCTTRLGEAINANIVFPGIDESKDIPMSLFNELIGYALHELGHVWFTDEETWNVARDHHGDFVNSLINGLEDPRIEQEVINSRYAPNSAVLFENLVNAVLTKDGYVQPDDLQNVPFLLAIEGRRLNGYKLVFDSIVDQSPWASDLHWALTEAHRAKSTCEIVGIAIELNKRLQSQQDQQKDQQKNQQKDQNQDQQAGQQDGQQQGQQAGDQAGQQSDQKSKQKNDQKAGKQGSGKGREVEPSSFIQDRLSEHQAKSDLGNYPRPNVGKPRVREIEFI
jgi:hypothetical protein